MMGIKGKLCKRVKMTDRELNIALREMARSKGLCNDWYGKWKDGSSIDECLDRYVRGFDFAVKNNYPPLEFIRNNFEKNMLHKHNIYLDDEIEIDCESGYYVFLGKCVAKLKVDGYKATTIYVRHESVVDVHISGFAKAFVSYYDSSGGDCFQYNGGVFKRYDRRKKEG